MPASPSLGGGRASRPAPRSRRNKKVAAGVAALGFAAVIGLTFGRGLVADAVEAMTGGDSPNVSGPAASQPKDSTKTKASSKTEDSTSDNAGPAETTSGAITQPGTDGHVNHELMARFDRAAMAAKREAGIDLVINSGWRSADKQRQLISERIAELGVEEAHKVVGPVDASAHVKGLALDIGPTAGANWMADNGYRFGLCQVYRNEPWHYEPLTGPGGTCPQMYSDSSVWWK